MSDRIKVMIVDDSAVVRQTVRQALERDKGIEVIAAASDPLFAISHMQRQWPDVIVLDIEMPRMDGLTFLKKIMTERPTPVVICSSLAETGAAATMQALSAGAAAIITKPKMGVKQFLEGSANDVVQAVKAAARANASRLVPRAAAPLAPAPKLSADAILGTGLGSGSSMVRTTERIVAIGTSTGGTQALEAVLTQLPAVCPGIVIVQHMPERFTAMFAERLHNLCAIEVREARHGDRVMPGRALIAPGGKHMMLARSGAQRGFDRLFKDPQPDAGGKDFIEALNPDSLKVVTAYVEPSLAAAKPETTEPLTGSYRGLSITTNRPPGGGVMLVEMLNILESFDLKAMGHNSADYIATVAEAMKIATVDKDQKIGDPRFVSVPMDELTSKAYAAEKAALIRSGIKTHVPRLKSKESADTTHVTAVDENGVCASMTHTLGTPSGVVTEGLGFMYNGAMAVFDPRPGRAGSLAPGKSRFSSMAPSIIFKDGNPMLVLGAPGGTYITMGILQVILNVVEFGMSALEAVSAPRFCATSDTIQLTNRILRSTEAKLAGRGYPVRRWPVNYHFAGVHAIRIVDGKLDGGADPGRDGMALAV
mgnify:CR=1 FL=1